MNRKTITDLYYGNITPCDINLLKHPKLLQTNQDMLKLIIQIEEIMGEKNIHIFDKYNDIINKHYAELQRTSYEEGFSLGIKLAVEALYKDNNNI